MGSKLKEHIQLDKKLKNTYPDLFIYNYPFYSIEYLRYKLSLYQRKKVLKEKHFSEMLEFLGKFKNILDSSNVVVYPALISRSFDAFVAQIDLLLCQSKNTWNSQIALLLKECNSLMSYIDYNIFSRHKKVLHFQKNLFSFYHAIIDYKLCYDYKGYNSLIIPENPNQHIQMAKPISNTIIDQTLIHIHYLILFDFYSFGTNSLHLPLKLTNKKIESLPREIQLLHHFLNYVYILKNKLNANKKRNETKELCLNLINQLKSDSKEKSEEEFIYLKNLSEDDIDFIFQKLSESPAVILIANNTEPTPLAEDELISLLRKYFSQESISISITGNTCVIKAKKSESALIDFFEKFIIKPCAPVNTKKSFTLSRTKTEITISIAFTSQSKPALMTYLKKNNLLNLFAEKIKLIQPVKQKTPPTHVLSMPPTPSTSIKTFPLTAENDIIATCNKIRFGGEVAAEINSTRTACSIKMTFLTNDESQQVILQIKKKNRYSLSFDFIKGMAERLAVQLGLMIDNIMLSEIHFTLPISNFDMFSSISLEKSILKSLRNNIKENGIALTVPEPSPSTLISDIQPNNPITPISESSQKKILPLDKAKWFLTQILPMINPECRWLTHESTRKHRHLFLIRLEKEGMLSVKNKWVHVSSLLTYLASLSPNNEISYRDFKLGISDTFLFELSPDSLLFNNIKTNIDSWIEYNSIQKTNDLTVPIIALPQKQISPPASYRIRKHELFQSPDLLVSFYWLGRHYNQKRQ